MNRGLREGADATLLGISDGLLGPGRPPRLECRPPWPLRLLRAVLRHICLGQPGLDWRDKLDQAP